MAVKGWKEQVGLLLKKRFLSWSRIAGRSSIRISIGKGRCRAFPIEVAQRLKQMTKRQLIVAGGIREQGEIDALDAIGVDAVAGMAVYSGVLSA